MRADSPTPSNQDDPLADGDAADEGSDHDDHDNGGDSEVDLGPGFHAASHPVPLAAFDVLHDALDTHRCPLVAASRLPRDNNALSDAYHSLGDAEFHSRALWERVSTDLKLPLAVLDEDDEPVQVNAANPPPPPPQPNLPDFVGEWKNVRERVLDMRRHIHSNIQYMNTRLVSASMPTPSPSHIAMPSAFRSFASRMESAVAPLRPPLSEPFVRARPKRVDAPAVTSKMEGTKLKLSFRKTALASVNLSDHASPVPGQPRPRPKQRSKQRTHKHDLGMDLEDSEGDDEGVGPANGFARGQARASLASHPGRAHVSTGRPRPLAPHQRKAQALELVRKRRALAAGRSVVSNEGAKKSTDKRPNRNRHASSVYDIDNIVIPVGMANNGPVVKKEVKEIVVPSWRYVVRDEHRGVKRPHSDLDLNASDCNGNHVSSSEEDTDDEVVVKRHRIHEAKERKVVQDAIAAARNPRRRNPSVAQGGDPNEAPQMHTPPSSSLAQQPPVLESAANGDANPTPSPSSSLRPNGLEPAPGDGGIRVRIRKEQLADKAA